MEGKIFRSGPAAGEKGMLPKLVALVALLSGALTLTVVATPPPPPTVEAQMEITDYDVNDNGLIEVSNLDQLNAMRWDLDGDGDPAAANTSSYLAAFPGRDTATSTRMGCPMGNCQGYELMEDLTFPTSTGPYNPWTPIGLNFSTPFAATFNANGHTLTGLTVSARRAVGLFGYLGSGGVIRDLGMINADVTIISSGGTAGAIVGLIRTGASIYASYAHGGRVTVATHTALGGGLAGANNGEIRASYAAVEVNTDGSRDSNDLGGLTGFSRGTIIASYAAGALSATGTGNYLGGLVGRSHTANSAVTDSYCDTEATRQSNCVGRQTGTVSAGTSTVTVAGKTTAELQAPTGYTGIYQEWNLDLDGDGRRDNLWDFGTESDYPALNTPEQRAALADSPPPGGPRVAQPPQDTPYDPAADHPEVYVNDRYGMTATCEVQSGADGSLIRFDLGEYQGAVILHLAVWNGEFFMSYESQDIDVPPLVRDGQSASVRVVTDPGETRFLLDGVSPTRNLVLGYADCHTDDPGAVVEESAEAAATSTEATPPPPKVYVNDRYEMTAVCDVQHNADGEPDGAVIRFDLGRYRGDVLLFLSLWNGEYYAGYESLGIDVPLLEREGQLASVRVVTDPGETRFLLDGTPNGLRMNLVLGYADCHTAGG